VYTQQIYIKVDFNLYEKVFIVLAFFSLFNQGILSYIVPLYLLIPLIDVKQRHSILNFKNIFSLEILYFIILYFFIKFFVEYNDSKEDLRMLMQTFDGRYLTQFIRFCLELFFGSYLYEKYKKNKDYFLKLFFLVLKVTLLIAVFDFFLFNKFLFKSLVGHELVFNRFTGFNLEPRHFGLILVYCYIFLSYMHFSNKKLFFLIFCIFLTTSISSTILFLISFALFSFKKGKIFLFLLLSIFLFSGISYLLFFYSDELLFVMNRISFIITLKNDNDYFQIFSLFEVFDRSALNALFNNIIYLFTGYGPNTISAVSTDYISNLDFNTYDGIINSPPHTGLINILSRSGIFILTLIVLTRIKKSKNIHFFIYLLQSSFLFYSFFLIIDNENKK
jgi:hypothetical protein